jgi:isoleucyl-tRNA synthetase
VEYEIDKKLGIKSKSDVLNMGIGVYNEECRKIVMRYAREWEQTITRSGRWIDFRHDYKTLDLNFMESVWWVFKTLFDKNLVKCTSFKQFDVFILGLGLSRLQSYAILNGL